MKKVQQNNNGKRHAQKPEYQTTHNVFLLIFYESNSAGYRESIQEASL